MTVRAFLMPHLSALDSDYQVTVVADFSDDQLSISSDGYCRFVSIPISRKISPAKDFLAFLYLTRLFIKSEFNIIHSITPKAGLIAMMAAWTGRAPVRVHWFTGQVWATKVGIKRFLLKMADRVTASLTTISLTDSYSQRDFLVANKVIDADRIRVLAAGSVCGVDTDQFRPDVHTRQSIRMSCSIPQDASVLLYVGRLTFEKGVLDLARAFHFVANNIPNVWLVLVGPDEDDLGDELKKLCGPHINRLCVVGTTELPQRFMAAADIFCMPSYREGFGLSTIEAAACGLPAVASRIYGLEDAVLDGQTGLMHAAGSVHEIADCLHKLLINHELRQKMGFVARERVENQFQQQTLTLALLDFYAELCNR
jgi:glycosyltransferase involved in cell wall biosynthesis